MSESAGKRTRKSKLEPRSCTEYEKQTKDEAPFKRTRKEPRQRMMKKKEIISESEDEPNTSARQQIQFNVQVEVESCDDDWWYEDDTQNNKVSEFSENPKKIEFHEKLIKSSSDRDYSSKNKNTTETSNKLKLTYLEALNQQSSGRKSMDESSKNQVKKESLMGQHDSFKSLIDNIKKEPLEEDQCCNKNEIDSGMSQNLTESLGITIKEEPLIDSSNENKESSELNQMFLKENDFDANSSDNEDDDNMNEDRTLINANGQEEAPNRVTAGCSNLYRDFDKGLPPWHIRCSRYFDLALKRAIDLANVGGVKYLNYLCELCNKPFPSRSTQSGVDDALMEEFRSHLNYAHLQNYLVLKVRKNSKKNSTAIIRACSVNETDDEYVKLMSTASEDAQLSKTYLNVILKCLTHSYISKLNVLSFKCYECRVCYEHLSPYLEHLRTEHGVQNNKQEIMIAAELHGDKFINLKAYHKPRFNVKEDVHVISSETNKPTFKCLPCKTDFKNDMKAYFKHRQSKPKCAGCGRRFQCHEVHRHIGRCTKYFNYVFPKTCPCKEIFNCIEDLDEHQASCSFGQSMISFTCLVCSHTSGTIHLLEAHQRLCHTVRSDDFIFNNIKEKRRKFIREAKRKTQGPAPELNVKKTTETERTVSRYLSKREFKKTLSSFLQKEKPPKPTKGEKNLSRPNKKSSRLHKRVERNDERIVNNLLTQGKGLLTADDLRKIQPDPSEHQSSIIKPLVSLSCGVCFVKVHSAIALDKHLFDAHNVTKEDFLSRRMKKCGQCLTWFIPAHVRGPESWLCLTCLADPHGVILECGGKGIRVYECLKCLFKEDTLYAIKAHCMKCYTLKEQKSKKFLAGQVVVPSISLSTDSKFDHDYAKLETLHEFLTKADEINTPEPVSEVTINDTADDQESVTKMPTFSCAENIVKQEINHEGLEIHESIEHFEGMVQSSEQSQEMATETTHAALNNECINIKLEVDDEDVTVNSRVIFEDDGDKEVAQISEEHQSVTEDILGVKVKQEPFDVDITENAPDVLEESDEDMNDTYDFEDRVFKPTLKFKKSSPNETDLGNMPHTSDVEQFVRNVKKEPREDFQHTEGKSREDLDTDKIKKEVVPTQIKIKYEPMDVGEEFVVTKSEQLEAEVSIEDFIENNSEIGIEPEVLLTIRDAPKSRGQYKCPGCSSIGIYKWFTHHVTVCGKLERGKRSMNTGHLLDLCTRFDCSWCSTKSESIREYFQHECLRESTCPCCDNNYKKYNGQFRNHLRSQIRQYYVPEYSLSDGTETEFRKRYRCLNCKLCVENEDVFNHWEKHLFLKEESATVKSEKEDSCDASVDYCPPEGEAFLSPEMLQDVLSCLQQVHERFQGKMRLCQVCARPSSRKHVYKVHLVEHLIADAYSKKTRYGALRCQICSSDHAKADAYKQHMREHACLPLYQCHICNKTFSDSSNFAKHKKVHNLEVKICDICLRKFQCKAMLIKHMKMHETATPQVCTHCPASFLYGSQLKKHIKYRHSTSPSTHSCSYCKLRLGSMKQKWDHEWEVHGERKHAADCPMCDEKFRKYSDVKAHLRKYHNLQLEKTDTKFRELLSTMDKYDISSEAVVDLMMQSDGDGVYEQETVSLIARI